ncbi:hypothetical protein [Floccifex sp.]|uniref:hypothetical protein n=1 Tax=Floccifex sp. TaxID=2815810 RepID=UPI003F0F9FFB
MIQITMLYILMYLFYCATIQTEYIKIHHVITLCACLTFFPDALISSLGFVSTMTGITMLIYLLRTKTESN